MGRVWSLILGTLSSIPLTKCFVKLLTQVSSWFSQLINWLISKDSLRWLLYTSHFAFLYKNTSRVRLGITLFENLNIIGIYSEDNAGITLRPFRLLIFLTSSKSNTLGEQLTWDGWNVSSSSANNSNCEFEAKFSNIFHFY